MPIPLTTSIPCSSLPFPFSFIPTVSSISPRAMLMLLSITSNQTTRPWSMTCRQTPPPTTRPRAIMTTKVIHLGWMVHHLPARMLNRPTDGLSSLRFIIMMTANIIFFVPVPSFHFIVIAQSYCFPIGVYLAFKLGPGSHPFTQMYATTACFVFSSFCYISIKPSKLEGICRSHVLFDAFIFLRCVL